MKDKILDILTNIEVFGIAVLLYGGAIVLLVFGIICLASIRAHGGGNMDAYITKVSRIGDRVFVTAKDSVDSSNTYDGCASSSDEQIFKDAIGEKVHLSWDGVFSMAPFWTECPGPIQIEEVKNEL